MNPMRRLFIGGLAVLPLMPFPAHADAGIAQSHVQETINTIMGILNGGQSTPDMMQALSTAIPKYADTPTIARSALGPPARNTDAATMQAFTKAFAHYLGTKYSKRFEDLKGGSLTISEVRQHKTDRFGVHSTMKTKNGTSSVNLPGLKSEASGSPSAFRPV